MSVLNYLFVSVHMITDQWHDLVYQFCGIWSILNRITWTRTRDTELKYNMFGDPGRDHPLCYQAVSQGLSLRSSAVDPPTLNVLWICNGGFVTCCVVSPGWTSWIWNSTQRNQLLTYIYWYFVIIPAVHAHFDSFALFSWHCESLITERQ